MAKKRVYSHIILDASASMGPIKTPTLKAFNDYIDGLSKEPDTSARVSLTTFNDRTGTYHVRSGQKAKKFAPLTSEDYQPHGNTPLYDAIADTVEVIDRQTRRESEEVVLVILTDGMENASRRVDKAAIAALLSDRQEKKGWLVIYLGANQDAMKEGAMMGVHAMSTMSYDTANIESTVATAALRSTVAYAASAGDRLQASFTSAERVSAMAPKLHQKPKTTPKQPPTL